MSERETKKNQFETAQPKSNKKPLLLVGVGLILVLAALGWSFAGGSSTRYAKVSPGAGLVSIPLDGVSDGKAHFYSLASGKQSIDFFVLKSGDGAVRAAFDACDVCYKSKKGYRQEGDFMVCNNCNMKFRSDRINEISGGCNPAPLKRDEQGGKLVIAESDIRAGAWYFGLK